MNEELMQENIVLEHTEASEQDTPETKMKKTRIKTLFIIRVLLWITAFVSTVWWIAYSVRLHMEEIFDVHEYATILRPVLYTCLLIAIVAICLSFALYMVSARIKRSL